MICVTRAGADIGVLASKISVLRQKLVIICATRLGDFFGVLRVKSPFYVKNLSLFVRLVLQQILAF